jgi:hypothetical protein
LFPADKVGVTTSKSIGALLGFVAAAVLAPLLVRAQQPGAGSRAGWPCGARVDPSYFRVAEGSGGHLLLLAPEEIGDSGGLLTAFGAHPQTISRLAGSMTQGLHEFPVPIDPSVESVLFSIAVQCLQTADIVRPSGPTASGDDVTELSNFKAERMVIVRRPEPGNWLLRVAGSGVAGIVVQAKSGIGIGEVQFAPADSATFSAVPSLGSENTIRIRLSGRVSDLRASLVDGTLQPLADLPLAAGEMEGAFLARFTPGGDGFRVLVAGRDADGFAFQRMTAPLLTPMR